MRLEYICDLELAYREEPTYEGKFLLVRPYGGEEGTGYGEGDGTLTGPKLQGKAHWVNHPHRRSDGAMLPDVHGSFWPTMGHRFYLLCRAAPFLRMTQASNCSTPPLSPKKSATAGSIGVSASWKG